ncbi:MAG: S-methyl-5'-thioinosine phosphorylase [Woeseiaceae bacterium]
MGRQFAIIAGSGFRDFGVDSEGKRHDTEFGEPSGPIRELQYDDQSVFLLPRHGDELLIPPHKINYRANMKALKNIGVDAVIAMNTVGVINANLHPGQIAIPAQLIDYTWGRAHSIYRGVDTIDHIDFTRPLTESLRRDLLDAAADAGVDIYDGGVYAATQGPRLETAAEVDRLERDGADFIGMTAMPEAALARELDLDYACLSLIVNYAAGRGEKPIHDDLEAGTMTAKMQAMKVLRVFFGAMEE